MQEKTARTCSCGELYAQTTLNRSKKKKMEAAQGVSLHNLFAYQVAPILQSQSIPCTIISLKLQDLSAS